MRFSLQSDQDATRYLELGAPRHAVQAIGNLKYDAEPTRAEPPRVITELIARLHPSTIWIAASTMPGADREDVDEDQAVIERVSGAGAKPSPALADPGSAQAGTF